MLLGQLGSAVSSYAFSGGTLTVGNLRRGDGTASFNWTGGTLNVQSNLSIAPGEVFSSFLSVGDGKELTAPMLTVGGSAPAWAAGGCQPGTDRGVIS
ncbi:MAG: hypothetical protein IPK20_17980 [Betaproteobacteria bacterium]|nr:hypothetical protein [Betaproteobacteria bacterium]